VFYTAALGLDATVVEYNYGEIKWTNRWRRRGKRKKEIKERGNRERRDVIYPNRLFYFYLWHMYCCPQAD